MQELGSKVHLIYRLERVEQYLHIEQEPKSIQRGTPPAYWPASGSLNVKNLNARYSDTGPNILHDVSFDIRSGERIGVGGLSVLRFIFIAEMVTTVGRTGSGKVSYSTSISCDYTKEGAEFLDHVSLASHRDGGGDGL
jgi:ABC-type multidrug transport system fused ATPase/permease subunit